MAHQDIFFLLFNQNHNDCIYAWEFQWHKYTPQISDRSEFKD